MKQVHARVARWLIASTLSVSASSLHAADIKPIKFDDGTVAILVMGDIQSGDAERFSSVAEKYDDAAVFLESDGGSVATAIKIGEAIRLKGFSTAVINESSCNSACALIWLAGSPRALSRSARIGFHAAYADVGGQARESGVANAMIGRYLTLLNLPEQAVLFATTSPPSSLNWLTASNFRSSGIETKVIDDLDLGKTDASRPQKKSESDLWRKAGDWSVYVDHTLDDSCFIIGSFANKTVFRIGLNQTDPGNYYLMIGNTDWRSLKEGQEYKLEFKFGRETPWEVPATGVVMGGQTDLIATFSDTAFWDEFVTSPYLVVTKERKPITTIQMNGARSAFDTMINCQNSANATAKARDPFAE